MNLALSAIIIIILLLPGAAVLTSYYTSLVEKESSVAIPLNDLLIRGLVISLFIHVVGVFFLKIVGLGVDFKLLYQITSSKDIQFSSISFTNKFLEFVSYNLLLTIGAWGVTKYFKTKIRQKNIDVNYHAFRLTNYWFHVFSARYLEGHGIQGTKDDTDLIAVDVLTKTNIIYTGFLIDFNYDPKKDCLDNLILKDTQKRNFLPDAERSADHSTGKPALIRGDIFLIPACEILNFNIYYLKVNTVTPSDNPQSPDNVAE